MVPFQVNLPEVFRLSITGNHIAVINKRGNINHEFLMDEVPHLVDYIKNDPWTDGIHTHVFAMIENRLLVVKERVRPEAW